MSSFVDFGLLAAGLEELVEAAEPGEMVEVVSLEATAVEESDCRHVHCHQHRCVQA